MSTYAFGDLQGCHARLDALLELIGQNDPDAGQADYLFVGDIVNRGPQSLATLRQIRALGDRARMVLGNHDLHLLAAAHGIRKPGRNDTLQPILEAPDCDALLDWLRHQPLALWRENHLIVHAGVLPAWTAEQALALAGEVEAALRGPDWIDFLRHMYGNQPARWDDGLQGHDRLRCIVNAFTRMRLCAADGSMVFDNADGGVLESPGVAWFDVPGRRAADVPIVYGHWSARGLEVRDNLIGLDSGCIWGGQLSALRLADRALFQVACPQYQAPGAGG
ncbi:MAG: symmetrical bis(5'-nucleosyl)-tetraphosphatase [Herminiimonas sp.]|nr:symmetrical bis(5'-nucleosyl)-tetraphosphatase [Herminiimonas sp.]